MKVVCESCQAKYQVPDERVAGKKLKIRCKRCGATVLIRGDLTQIGLSDAPQPTAEPADLAPALPAAELEWHASIDGQSYGPFDTSTLLRWLDEQPGGWDAHVWRDGFSDWVEVRSCPELMAAAPAASTAYDALPAPPESDPEAEAEAASPEHEDEGPTRTFSNDDVLGARRPSPRSSDDLRARASSIRTRSSPALTAVPAAAMGSLSSTWSSGQAAAASPRVTAAQAMTGERHEDSVLFSTANLQQVAMTTSQPGYGPGANPGFASGEASGLIDIRALASLARQNQPQIAPGAAYDRFRADDDSRMAVMNQTGAFNRVDSLAPVSTTSTSSSAAVPLAILGGFALVAAAAFAAILITREAKGPETAAAVVPETTATTAQPTVTPEPTPTPTTMPAAAAPEPAKPEEKIAEPSPAAESEELANGKAAKRRGSRTAEEKGAKETMPADKAKPKKEEKAPPPSLDEVMVAEKPKPAKPEKVEPEPKHEPAKAHTGNSDIDDLLGGSSKPAAKTPSKSRSIDDLLEGAVDDKKKEAKPAPAKEAAPAPAPAAAAASKDTDDLPEQPSRDEVLAAMRGVESAVRACATPETKGMAAVEITVSGSSGRVTNATVTGITGEPGSCIARAARNAKFPHFAKPTFQVKYPYRFQ